VKEWLWCVGISLLASVGSFWGVGGFLHYHYYVRRRGQAAGWKLQPERWLGRRQVRQAFALGSVNILAGALLGGTFAWQVARGGGAALYFDAARFGWAWLAASAVLGFVLIDAGLYYSHRLLHHRALFRYVHRWHHKFVAPIVFTTTAMHPIEFLVFFCVLLLPALVVPMYVGVYVALVAYTYLVGMVDHLGVRLRLPLHGETSFHDEHHVHFHCNYGHHTTLFDRLHGTVRRRDRVYGEDIFYT
jgi:lathosterol oxidase